jgi:spermidine/putrescine transport system ATP-binding protein
MSSPDYLRTIGLTKRYGANVVCDALDLQVREGEFFSIVGPSGSGKTTLLRMLTGMVAPTAGEVVLDGVQLTNTPPQRRPTCLVFQSLALFPHRTVGQNIEFPLKMKRVGAVQRRQRALELLTQLRLADHYYDKPVTECSGGERQRVALARSLAYDPDILFFDEPLSAIDYQLRKILQRELKDIHRATGRTFVYVTHSLEEALVMSDRLGIMRGGSMLQVGTPAEIYLRPASKFVAEFMGEANVFDVARRNGSGLLFSRQLGRDLSSTAGASFNAGHLVVRPEYMRFVNSGDETDNTLWGQLVNEYVLGSRIQYHVDVEGITVTVEKLAGERYRGSLDDEVLVGWDAQDAWLVER